jgi:hypothetical protein
MTGGMLSPWKHGGYSAEAIADRRKAAEAGVRLGAALAATAKIAFANVADFVECDEDGRVKVNEEGQLQLRSDLTREDLEAISTITVNDRGRVSWIIDRGPALKAPRDLLHPMKTKVELTGANDAPLLDVTKLSDADIASLIRILEGAITGSSEAGQGGGADRRIRERTEVVRNDDL